VQYTLNELAELTGCDLVGDGTRVITGVESLDSATVNDASFLENPRYRDKLAMSKAGVVCVDPNSELVEGNNYLITKRPSEAFQQIAETLLAHRMVRSGFEGIHATAVVHESAKIGEGCIIGPYAVVDAGAKVGKGSEILAHAFVGPNAVLGENCLLFQGAIVREGCQLGNRVILQPGAVIGSCGFGYLTNERGEHVKLKQLGIVVLEDDVEIGSGTTIDRGRFKETRVRRGSKLDNLVQLGHNVEIGTDNMIVAQTGIAGSTKTGRWVVLGGQVGVAGHIEICDHVMVGSKGGVTKSVKAPGKYNGTPLQPLGEFNRYQVGLRRVASYEKRLKKLENLLAELADRAIAD
jgi:UDP-3-O-[3-hydroxymyristoyl] glucosamine N-acyltransferase